MSDAVCLVALGNIYWTDQGSDLIGVSRLNTVYRAVIISEALDQPRAIGVQPLEGYVIRANVHLEISSRSTDGCEALSSKHTAVSERV